jgi:hypothetical protein
LRPDGHGVTWSIDHGTTTAAWAEIGGVAFRDDGTRLGAACSIYDRSGNELGRLPLWVKQIRGRPLQDRFAREQLLGRTSSARRAHSRTKLALGAAAFCLHAAG